MTKKIKTVLKPLTVEEIKELGLKKPGEKAVTLNSVNSVGVGTAVEIMAVENGGKVYRAKFLAGPKVGEVIRVETFVLA